MAAAAALFCASFGETLKLGPATPPDPEKEHQRRLEKRAAKLKKTGGRIIDMKAMKGAFRFVNMQGRVPVESLKDVCDRLARHFQSDFAIVAGKGGFSVEGAGKAL